MNFQYLSLSAHFEIVLIFENRLSLISLLAEGDMLISFCQSSINAISSVLNSKTGDTVGESIKSEFAIMLC